ncbi:MAG: hypothetical protein CMP22_00110 [Rickettsiales bacterium]|nr:hypothetical protein [Rickettsiales bacterium]
MTIHDVKEFIQNSPSFALLEKAGKYFLIKGKLSEASELQDIETLGQESGRSVFFCVPFNTISEKGCEAIGFEKILTMPIDEKIEVQPDFFKEFESHKLSLNDDLKAFPNDQDYIDMVEKVRQKHVIGGDATQVVLSRSFDGQFLSELTIQALINLFYQASLTGGQYQTLLMVDRRDADANKHQYLLTASPECHVEVTKDDVTMIPIAGTFRKHEKSSPDESDIDKLERLKSFLDDQKEINELFQVVDEEVKMMGVLCPNGGKISGPFLREIGTVIHTEYHLKGSRQNNQPKAIDALRQTMHAPTLVGGPLKSAARIIAKNENISRGYYGGEIGIYNPDDDTLDCSIFIRGAHLRGDGTFSIRAGAGVVRDSDPVSEELETRAKAGGMIGVLTGNTSKAEQFLDAQKLEILKSQLNKRNEHLSHFWITKQNPIKPADLLKGLTVTIINNEDDFAFMIAHLLNHNGCQVKVVDTLGFDLQKDTSKLVVLGPGPGDINDESCPKMVALNEITSTLLASNRLILGVCLGHQALSKAHDIDVVLQEENTQGVQRIIPFMGQNYRLGFYNSFSPVLDDTKNYHGLEFDIDKDNRILGMSGGSFTSFQFHPESVLSEKGHEVLTRAIIDLRLTRMA